MVKESVKTFDVYRVLTESELAGYIQVQLRSVVVVQSSNHVLVVRDPLNMYKTKFTIPLWGREDVSIDPRLKRNVSNTGLK